jgi:hypothetical protein
MVEMVSGPPPVLRMRTMMRSSVPIAGSVSANAVAVVSTAMLGRSVGNHHAFRVRRRCQAGRRSLIQFDIGA